MAEIKTPKSYTHLKAITSIDGRFRGRIETLSDYFSEYATIKGRVFVELEYLIAFLEVIEKPLNKENQKKLRSIAQNFNEDDAWEVWKKDEEINHDAKAVEYILAVKLEKLKMGSLVNYLHFGLTTADVDGTALALSLKDFTEKEYIPRLQSLIGVLQNLARENKNLVMLARTHGQIAVPTTAGKEMANFADRLKTQLIKFKKIKIGAKLTGAVGNYNALVTAFPKIDWLKFSRNFLNKLGLEAYTMTTQIEPLDHKIEYMQAVKRINLVVQAFDEDIWRYLALGYLSLRDKSGHVGSSTMPQKINPIGFELSESYTDLANGILDVLERRLPRNRWQRDLTDKYVLRDLGQALAMSVLSYETTADSIKNIGFNKDYISKELESHWESIAEGIQTILRTTNITQPYEKLKELTRGKFF